ncbi:TniQ family protein [Kitasatospora sp. NA04385]|uniref:TniQ family protein n=1 Tax=Kitasatospora sp. NA04385 TaxID=2742135 RepID=UPI0015929F7C|nr:TniQ family protein [Kitasatospora sp. NA04385]QKW20225.1 TniQ family protein [Kitasatospora sp. NA04385]
MTGDVNTVPLRAAPIDGESVDSWIEELARRHRLSPSQLLPALGLPERARSIHRLIKATPEESWRRMECVAGMPEGGLRSVQLAGQAMRMTLVGGGTRFCPVCLGENGGRWLLAWRSNWAVACTRHRLLLLDSCPSCARTLRVYLPGGTEELPPGTCAYQPQHRSTRCGTDLAALSGIPAPQVALEAQDWIDGLQRDADRNGDLDSAITLDELPAVAYWLMGHEGTDWQARAAELAPGRARTTLLVLNGRLPKADAPLVAVVLDMARTVLGADHEAGVAAVRELSSGRRTRTGVVPAGMNFHRWKTMKGPFPNRFLQSIDTDMTPMDRLRFKSPTPQAGKPGNRTAETRGRHIPHLIWPDWAGLLLPLRSGFRSELFRATAATCLLIPGSSERAYRDLTTHFNRRVTSAHLSVLLQSFGDLPESGLTDVLAAFCRIADYLDTCGSPIDYQRRRERIPAHSLITWPQWRDLACEAGFHPGKSPRDDQTARGRHLHAQRHLLQLLTGADLGVDGHRFGFTGSSDHSRYVTFTHQLTLPLRSALAGHAQRILDDLEIDEPVTWSPPLDLAHGLTLPGALPSTLDTTTIRRIVIEDQRPVSEAAEVLGVHVEHVALALQHLDRPERDWSPRALPQSWKRRQAMPRIATRDFFEHEYVGANRTLHDLAAETGFSRSLLAQAARSHKIPLNKGKAPAINDPAWLRDQYHGQRKSTSTIAEELGTTQMTVNNALHRLGVTPRPPGIHSSEQMINRLDGRLAKDIRAAVEGSLGGWERLHRFQIAMVFPTLKAAAEHLGIPPRTLVVQFQRLERDIGAEIFVRSTGGTPQQPTKRGRRLLDHLEKPHIRSQMAKSIADHELDRLAEHQAAAAQQQFPRPRRSVSPFTEIPVTRLRITAAMLALLKDLMTHSDGECYGALVIDRLKRDPGNIYEQLHRLQAAGWITNRVEDDASWNSRATPGRGPGRRRTYYRLTSAGRDAILHEIARWPTRRRTRERAQSRTDG